MVQSMLLYIFVSSVSIRLSLVPRPAGQQHSPTSTPHLESADKGDLHSICSDLDASEWSFGIDAKLGSANSSRFELVSYDCVQPHHGSLAHSQHLVVHGSNPRMCLFFIFRSLLKSTRQLLYVVPGGSLRPATLTLYARNSTCSGVSIWTVRPDISSESTGGQARVQPQDSTTCPDKSFQSSAQQIWTGGPSGLCESTLNGESNRRFNLKTQQRLRIWLRSDY